MNKNLVQDDRHVAIKVYWAGDMPENNEPYVILHDTDATRSFVRRLILNPQSFIRPFIASAWLYAPNIVAEVARGTFCFEFSTPAGHIQVASESRENGMLEPCMDNMGIIRAAFTAACESIYADEIEENKAKPAVSWPGAQG